MASDKGSIATEDALLTATRSLAHHGAPHPPTAESLAYDPSRPKSLKRTRETTPTSPTSAFSGDQPGALGSPTKAARYALASARPSVPLTGAAALEDQRLQREQEEHRLNPPGSSENPNQKVLTALAGDATSAMSRPADAPQAPTASMDVSSKLHPSVSIPSTNHNTTTTDTSETSPQSAASGASMAGALVTASPTPMDVDPSLNDQVTPTPQGNHDDKAPPGSLSYPGSLHAGSMQAPPTPHRNMSFPMPSPGQDSQGQTSGKKHKCPYCDTEFTRHHNLKSHLLTHSQEKPFVCSQCDSKFRRLHDLKRHSKLHTGEKNHTCVKCHRKFARGDALARHSKGPGGCAGRRSSMGTFADGDGMDGSMHEGDESMSGVYPGDESMTEEERRQLSLPSIKASHVSGALPPIDPYPSHPRTYPPAGSLERPPGGLYPPPLQQDRPAHGAHAANSLGGHTTSTSMSSVPSVGGSAIYSQGAGMTESPKPLSPSATAHDANNGNRQRSPSLTQQFQQQHFGRRLSGRQSPPGLFAHCLPRLLHSC